MMEIVQKIYRNLSDEVSRKIFISRLEYSITEDIKKLKAIFDCIGLSERILEKVNCGSSIVIFGAGAYGKRLVTLYPEVKWEAFCDNDNQLWGGKCLGLPIISVEDLKENYQKSLLVISPCYCWEPIVEQIRKEKIGNEYVLLREIIDNTVGMQYFSGYFIKPKDEEIFVDAGVLDGLSTIDFKKWSGKHYKYSYLFEPQKDVISDIENNLKDVEYKLIDKGLWNKKTNLYFLAGTEDNPGGFSVTEEENQGEKVEVTTIDEELIDVPVTYIKMDIEGSEYNALLGAKEVIRKYKPRLAICVYHKPEDIIELPRLILELNPHYKLYLRHYSFSWSETVVYAISE